MAAVLELTPALGAGAACRAMGLWRGAPARQQVRVHRVALVGPRTQRVARPRPPLALDAQENQILLDTLNSERFVDPESGKAVWLKAGRFGPYVEMATDDKPKRASLPKGWPPVSVDLEKAMRLLRLPREVGIHPDDGAPILAGIGRYGPYVQHSGTYANIESAEEVFEVGINRAVTLLAEKRAGRAGRGESTALKDLGAHPADGAPQLPFAKGEVPF